MTARFVEDRPRSRARWATLTEDDRRILRGWYRTFRRWGNNPIVLARDRCYWLMVGLEHGRP